jgi:hypothetical protein
MWPPWPFYSTKRRSRSDTTQDTRRISSGNLNFIAEWHATCPLNLRSQSRNNIMLRAAKFNARRSPQHGPAPVQGDGRLRTEGGTQQENTGARADLESGNTAHALCFPAWASSRSKFLRSLFHNWCEFFVEFKRSRDFGDFFRRTVAATRLQWTEAGKEFSPSGSGSGDTS